MRTALVESGTFLIAKRAIDRQQAKACWRPSGCAACSGLIQTLPRLSNGDVLSPQAHPTNQKGPTLSSGAFLVCMARPGRFDLLHHMLRSRNGVAVDTLSEFLSISKNAARQHVISLERSGYIAPSSLKATGRRPQQLYSITNAGVDLIPKRYSSMAGMLIETIAEQDSRNFSKIMKNMGKKVGQSASSARAMDTIELVEVMDSLGYEAELGSKKMKLSPTTACTII